MRAKLIKDTCLYASVLISLSFASLAQNTPWWELHGAFQFTNSQTGQVQDVVNSVASFTGSPSVNVGTRLNMIGWDFSAQENTNSWFGGIVDFSGGYGSKSVTLFPPKGTPSVAKFSPALFTMGGGPQFSFRHNERIQPFFRVILAAAYSNLNPNTSISNIVNAKFPAPSTSDTNLALLFGSGFDYRLKRYAFFRIAGDYIHTFVFEKSENNFRVTAGVSFRIGNK